jgi:hypothetical protein
MLPGMHERTRAIRITPQTATALQHLAARLGYLQRQGPQVGEGSIRLLLEALIAGDLALVRSVVRSEGKGDL